MSNEANKYARWNAERRAKAITAVTHARKLVEIARAVRNRDGVDVVAGANVAPPEAGNPDDAGVEYVRNHVLKMSEAFDRPYDEMLDGFHEYACPELRVRTILRGPHGDVDLGTHAG